MDGKHSDEMVDIQLHSSIQHPGQDKEAHTFQMIGKCMEKNGATYLQYEEEQDGQKIRSIVKLGNEEALIMRSGAIKMRLPLSINEMRLGEYRNQQMMLNLQVKTKALQFTQVSEREGKFSVAYELHAEGSLLGKYELSITYAEGQK